MSDPTATKHETVLDVTAERIARTYAQGFLGAVSGDAVGPDAVNVGGAVEELEAVHAEVLAAHPRFAEALCSAFLDHAARVAMIDRVIGPSVRPAVTNLLKVLSSHGRMDVVGEVVRQARKLHDQSAGRAKVVVRLARPADAGLMAEIEQTIRAKTGVDPQIEVQIDPELIGGLEVRVGDTVFDGAVRTALRSAHKSIVEQTVRAIERNPQRFTQAT